MDEEKINQHFLAPLTQKEVITDDRLKGDSKLRSYLPFKKSHKNWQESYFATATADLKEGYYRISGLNKLKGDIFDNQELTYHYKGILHDIENFKGTFKKFLSDAQIQNLENISLILKRSAKISRKLDFSHYLNQLKTAYKQLFESSGKSKENQKLRIADIAYAIQKQIAKLEVNQSLLIPAGCTYWESGDSILIEISHYSKDFYKLTIVNTGAGIHTQKCMADTLRNEDAESPWKMSDYEVNDHKVFEDITDINFLIDLINPDTTTNYASPGSMRKGLGPIVHYLLQDQPECFQKGYTHRTIRKENCFHDSVMSWLESKMDHFLFDCLELYMTKKGLQRLEACDLKKY